MSTLVKIGSVGMDRKREGVWLVGRITPRFVKGKVKDTVPKPHWHGKDSDALRQLMRLVLEHEPDLFHLFILYAMQLASAYLYAPGPTIRRERERKGWTQARLSRASRVCTRQIRRIECGHCVDPKAVTIARLMEALRHGEATDD